MSFVKKIQRNTYKNHRDFLKSLTNDITFDIIINVNNVILRRRYGNHNKTDKKSFEYESD